MKYFNSLVLHACAIGLVTTNIASAVQYRVDRLLPSGAVSSSAGGASSSNLVGYAEWTVYYPHAILWTGTNGNYVDLHPAGFGYSMAEDADGNSQVGFGTSPEAPVYQEHALLWKGSAESVIDLHPLGELYADEYSYALGVSGASQVGYVTRDNSYREQAFLWNGTAESATSLHPAGFVFSAATGVFGSNQVGWASDQKNYYGRHALLWSGTAESAIDLHPVGFATSEATDVWGTQQLGFVRGPSTGFWNNALLWNGSAAGYIDLHPPGFVSSEGLAISGEFQVGSGTVMRPVGYETHALVWKGTADSAIDLHQYLGMNGYHFEHSYAVGITEDGAIFGVAYDINQEVYTPYAFLWTPIPEPSTFSLVACGLLVALARRCDW